MATPTTIGTLGYYGAGAIVRGAVAGTTPTTTELAILEALALAVEALTPANVSGQRYERHSSDDPRNPEFREYAEENSGTCFRWFEIETDGWTPAEYSNLHIERRATTIDLVVAYPHTFGKYAALKSDYSQKMQALRGVLAADLSQIMEAIGVNGKANYPSGAFPLELETIETPERGVGVTFGVVTWPVEYFFDTNA